MFSRQTIVQAAAAAIICAASAIAQAAPAGDHPDDQTSDKIGLAQWHAHMCSDRYARQVGEMAYLETKLALTDAQRPLFVSWKGTVLAGAQSRESVCEQHQAGAGYPASILDREARLHAMLEARLAEMDAQHPAMAALYQSLTADQKLVFDGMGHGHAQGHGADDRGWHHHGSPRGPEEG